MWRKQVMLNKGLASYLQDLIDKHKANKHEQLTRVTIDKFTIIFDNGYSVIINILFDNAGVYIDSCLVDDNGVEVMLNELEYELLNEYYFEDKQGNIYIVELIDS